MHEKDLNIEQIIDRYLNNEFSRQDFIYLMENISKGSATSEFQNRLYKEWEKEIDLNLDQETSLLERLELRHEALNIVTGSKKCENTTPSGFRIEIRRIIYYAAVIAFVVISSASVYYFMNKNKIQMQSPACTVSIPAGEKKEIQLPDESNVYINSASTLKYPEIFNQDERVVELAGEAFFKITPNKEKPFIINAGQISIKVVGTSFNVRSYNEDEWIAVTVSTGIVSVSIFDENSSIQLTPKEELWINKKDKFFQKSKKDVLQAASWIDGFLYFDKTPIKDVVNALNRKYAVNIVLERPAEEYTITGEHDNKSLQSVLESICFITNLKQKKSGDDIILY